MKTCPICGKASLVCPCIEAGLTAKAQLIVNHERWRERGAQPETFALPASEHPLKDSKDVATQLPKEK